MPLQQRSSLEAYRPLIEELTEARARPQAIYDRLRMDHPDFSASVSVVKRMCRAIERERGARAEDVAIALESEPGGEAQVDFGSVGPLYDPTEGRRREAYVFVMVLSFSRHLFARICFDQKVETWLWLHAEAFEHFGGVPRLVVPDNLKSAVVRAAFSPSDETTLNRSYQELARHYDSRSARRLLGAHRRKAKSSRA